MTELSIFDFEGQEIRVCGSAEQPEWVVTDVGAVLGISQSTLSERVSKMPENWKGIGLTDTLGGQQKMLTVTEPGLYELIFRSDKPAAQRFRVWMFEEVLPSIRRTGSYSHVTPEQTVDAQVSQLIELAQTQVEVINTSEPLDLQAVDSVDTFDWTNDGSLSERSVPIIEKPRYFTEEEADAMKTLAKEKTEGARHAKRAYEAAGKIEEADAKVHKHHRKYEGVVADNELVKKRADARLGKHLHGLRPAYARLGMGLEQAASNAETRISEIKAKLQGTKP
ncbi:BRO family protein [Microcoleus sp. CAWBG640]|uniref:BRO-N domain-containing protein n=1 Tax=Microcoleus sp. CAWBG640 TaxID=2841653 RepID=UPI00312B5A38